jgi:Head domain of trimeric autotransporter adhesin
MAVEQFADFAQTNVDSFGISLSGLSFGVVSTTGFPMVGNFRILVDSELMLVTVVSGLTFTVTRGIEGTVAAVHAAGAAVTLVLTSGSLTTGFVRADETMVQAGASSSASGANSIAIGNSASASGNYAAAIGGNATAVNSSVAVGSLASASVYFATAIGASASAYGPEGATAAGYYAKASGNWATAVGSDSSASGYYATALGVNANASGNLAVAIGPAVTAAAGDVAIGNNYGTLTLARVGTRGLTAIKYASDTLAGNGLSSIVANVSLTGQTSSISAAHLYEPYVNGTFRVSIYILTTTAGTAGSASVTIGWSDDKQAQTLTPISGQNLTTAGSFMQAMVYIRAAASVWITYSATLTGAAGGPQYSLFVNVERLS